MDTNTMNNYKIHIYERYRDLKQSGKVDYDNNDLWKIFEYYSCIKLSKEYKQQFYEYDDIDPTFKEQNKMSRNDTGIDACNLIDTIVQCKLRKDILNWRDCSTFFGSQNIFCKEQKKTIVRWNNLIITRNKESTLSENLLEKQELFTDKRFSRRRILKYCEDLIKNPPKYPVINDNFKLRDYQIECINLIKNTKKNTIICLPTGTGKNVVIINSLEVGLKYLILVPRIILMDQLQEEIIKFKPELKSKIQLIGDNNDTFRVSKDITICVFNSVHIVEKYAKKFTKIFVDEAHHINIPEIYTIDNDDCEDNLEEVVVEPENGEVKVDAKVETKVEAVVDESTYLDIIRTFIKYNNNVYLSATIDGQKGFEYYKKDIREMIEKGYLCDYTIHVPVFNNDPTNRNICEYLVKKYRNIIIYCNSQKEGVIINSY